MWSYELITVVNNDKQLYSKGAKFCDDGRDYLIITFFKKWIANLIRHFCDLFSLQEGMYFFLVRCGIMKKIGQTEKLEFGGVSPQTPR